MPTSSVRTGIFRGTRGRIVELLRRSALSANDIGGRLGLTHNAVRPHLAALQKAGVVREAGRRLGVSRPTTLYELAPRAESLFSGAYIPFVAHLLRTLGERMTAPELHELMTMVGRSLATDWPPLRGDLRRRVGAATKLLAELGALTEVERADDGYVIRGYGCLLAEAVHGRPEVCRAVESLLAELLNVPVRECCERGDRPRCCFRVASASMEGQAS